MKRSPLCRLACAVIAVAMMFGIRTLADSIGINFESYSVGSVNNQDGWNSTGSAGQGCAQYDHEISPSQVPSFGSTSLRMSNAVTSGCFGDQTFSKPLLNDAGEPGAASDGLSGGVRQNHFQAEWSFASATPYAEQAGLSVVASPDRGDGARMSWVQMKDTPKGLAVNFYDYQRALNPTCGDAGADPFVFTSLATKLDRSVPHTIRISMQFVVGPANDVVRVYVDGVLRHTGTSWEDYFRDCEDNPTRPVDSILFRTGGTAAPATMGNGFFIDNLTITSDALVGPPANTTECKDGGWATFNNPAFENQGQCVSYVQNAKN